jgi:type II secretory pathway predicted ATPase ExeA
MAVTRKDLTMTNEMKPGKDMREAFGLRSIPFTREFSSRWNSAIFSEPLAALLGVVDYRMSGSLIAPAGTGKTALMRDLRDRLPEARFRVHYVKVTSLSKPYWQRGREVAAAIGLEPVGTYPNLIRKLQDKIEDTTFCEGLRPVLLIDEVHDMKPEVLAILRILTNFDMDSKLVLSVILAGQPPLAQMLARNDMIAIRQRIAHCATLRLLSREESKSYVEHRMSDAGAHSQPFDEQALDAIYEITRGNLRAIDSLARKALELAAKRGVTAIGTTLVTAARQLLPS